MKTLTCPGPKRCFYGLLAILIALLSTPLTGRATVTQTYTSSTTWTCPSGVTSIAIAVQGGGGGGGGGGSTSGYRGGGGGGGGCAYSSALTVVPGRIYTVTVGGGGSAGSSSGAGGNGGDSSFSGTGITTLTGGGGTGGGVGVASGGTIPGGGTASGGTVNYSGGNGTAPKNTASGGGGGGAGTTSAGSPGSGASGGNGGTGSPAGGNGTGNGGTVGGGSNGNPPGGGGAGAYRGSATQVGYAGGRGQVTITYTPAPPAVATTAATGLSSTSATLNGQVTSNGGDSVTDYGFYYGTTTPVTTGNGTKAQKGTSDPGTASFGLTVNSLAVNTHYYSATYAVNPEGTTLDSATQQGFWTLANLPQQLVIGSPTTNSLQITLGAGDLSGANNPTTVTFAIQETNSGKYVNHSTGALQTLADYQSAATWNPSGTAFTVTGLNSGTSYTFVAYAQNGAGTATAASPSASFTTSSSITPTKLVVTAVPVGAVAGNAFSVTVQAQDDNGNLGSVTQDTGISLSLASGSGTLSGNTAIIPNGQTSVTLSGVAYTKAESITLQASAVSGMSLTTSSPSSAFTVAPGAVSASNSTVVASPTTLAADNSTTSTVTVTLADANNNLLGAGTNVSWSATGGLNTLSPASSGTTAAGGTVSFTIKSFRAETKTITVTVGATVITNALQVTFTAPAIGNSFTWDPAANGTGSDGNGVWSAGSTPVWANGGADYVWADNGNDNATFGSGAALAANYSVSLGVGLSVANLTFNTTGTSHQYTLGNQQALNLAGTPNISVAGAATISGTLAGTGFTKTGAGTLTLSGANTYTGNTTVSAGTLSLQNSAALGNASGTLTMNGGNLNTGSGSTTISANNPQAWNADFTFTGTGSLNLGSGAVTLGGSRQVTVSANTLTVGGPIGDGGHAYGLTKAGTGTLVLSGTNTYTGVTTVSGGILNLQSTGTLANASSLVVSGGSLQLLPASVWGGQTVSTPLSLSGGAVGGGNGALFVQADGYTVTVNSPITLTGDAVVEAYSAGETLALSGPISGAYALTFYANGASTNHNQRFVLSNASPTWGNTKIDNYAANCEVQLSGGANLLPTNTVLSLSAGAWNAACVSALDLNGQNQTVAGLQDGATLTGPRRVVNTSATLATFTVNGTTNYLFSGTLGGKDIYGTVGNNLALTVAGGSLTLKGNNTYTGNTTITGGNLALTNTATLSGTTNIVVGSGATFDVSGLTGAFALGTGQTLSDSAPGAILNGTNDCSAGTLALVYDGVNPALIITNGGLKISAGTVITVNDTGASLLPGGVYKLIARAASGNVGLVAGAVPTVTVANGSGLEKLGIVNGELYLTNGLVSTWGYIGSTFTYNGSVQSPTISLLGSTGAATTNYVGTGATIYNGTLLPSAAGTYYVSNTVAADANYFGATNTQFFTISPATPTVTPVWTAGTAFTYNGGAQGPVLTSVSTSPASTGSTNVQYAGTGTTSYGPSSTPPSNVGTYQVTVTIGSDANNNSATSAADNFTISSATPALSIFSSVNPVGYLGAVTFTANLPTNATGSVVFSSTNRPFSTNALTSGSATSASLASLPRGTNLISVAYSGDSSYNATTSSYQQVVTNHPPAAAVMNLVATSGLPTEIRLSDLATNWSDVDGDSVELTALTLTSTNGATVTPINLTTNLDGSYAVSGRSFLGYTAPVAAADQIQYTISDGYGGTATGYINVTIQSSVTGTNSIVRITGGSPTTLMAYGVPGFSYVTQRATNLISPVWVNVATNTAGTNGVINANDTFEDVGGTPPVEAFYRLLWQP